MWRELQHDFADAVRTPGAAVPPGMRDPAGRMDVYRNNVAVSLREALGEAFPVVKSLVGEEFFAAMAQVYVRQTLPVVPLLMHYGADFADFVAGFEPAQTLPYLADVARLERAWLDAYHAADAVSLAIGVLASVDEEALERVTFHLHPSMDLVASDWPVVSIWQAHHGDEAPDLSALQSEPQSALIIRPHMDVNVHPVTHDFYEFLNALAVGECLGAAFDRLAERPDVDLGQLLNGLFEAGCIIGMDV